MGERAPLDPMLRIRQSLGAGACDLEHVHAVPTPRVERRRSIEIEVVDGPARAPDAPSESYSNSRGPATVNVGSSNGSVNITVSSCRRAWIASHVRQSRSD